MAVFSTRNDFFNRRAKGLGVTQPFALTTGGNGTTANAGAGALNPVLLANSIGSTFPTTLQGIPIPAPAATLNLILSELSANSVKGVFLANFYKIGTCNLAATGNQFTHDAATFPVTRTIFGAATQPVPLIPMFQVTTALTVTAAVLKIQNATGPAAGYVNQDGSSITGTTAFTFPSATTAVHSCYIPMLEPSSGTTPGDSAVTDITAINVTTGSTTGAMTVWGLEYLSCFQIPVANVTGAMDSVFAGFSPRDLEAAVATAGTATSFLGAVAFAGNELGGVMQGIILGAANK